MAKIAYQIRDSLYLSITNRCTNSCVFCSKFENFVIKGHDLKLDQEPTATEVIQAIGDPTPYKEIVFCGYGEPLLRLELIKEVASWLKQQGAKVRINSDGQANLVQGRDILPELKGLIDSISISLNASSATEYQQLCQSPFDGELAYQGVKDFLQDAVDYIPKVTASAVAYPGIDMNACAAVADELGVEFREREYKEGS